MGGTDEQNELPISGGARSAGLANQRKSSGTYIKADRETINNLGHMIRSSIYVHTHIYIYIHMGPRLFVWPRGLGVGSAVVCSFCVGSAVCFLADDK